MTSSIQQTSDVFVKPASPSRTSTSSSSSTGSQISPMNSPNEDSIVSQSLLEPRNGSVSPPPTNTAAEQHFFGALSSRVRGRSRSRSPANVPQDRSRSPMPPTNRISADRDTSPALQLRQSRQFSDCSGSTLVENIERPQTRRGTDSSERKPVHWQGRHANQWLFNDFSIVDTIKGVARRARRDS